jgi:hypothetical protein
MAALREIAKSAVRVSALLTLIVATLVGGVWVKSLLDRTERERAGVTVYVDNFSDRDVTVRVDGAEWVTAEKGTSRTLTSLAEGSHRVEVLAGGAVLETHHVQVTNGERYVLNALGGQVYTSREVNYSVAGTAPFSERDDRRITDRWFQAEDDDVFTDPPETVSLPKGTTTASRRWLIRGVPADTPGPGR